MAFLLALASGLTLSISIGRVLDSNVREPGFNPQQRLCNINIHIVCKNYQVIIYEYKKQKKTKKQKKKQKKNQKKTPKTK